MATYEKKVHTYLAAHPGRRVEPNKFHWVMHCCDQEVAAPVVQHNGNMGFSSRVCCYWSDQIPPLANQSSHRNFVY